MDTLPISATESENRRLAREAADVREAQADIEAGRYVDANDIDAWIDSIGTDRELPPPPTRQR